MSIAFGAAAACASAGDENAFAPGTDTPPATDGGAEASTNDDAGPKGPARCSGAGWCVTPLPIGNLTMRDIWPFRSRAYAIAESATLGIKILAWDDSDPQWKYIDDDTQNEIGVGQYAGRIWAPSEDEIYYIISPGYIYHGRRGAPDSPWVWERKLVVDAGSGMMDPMFLYQDVRPLGVWGTSADDVYAWYNSTIFHRKSVGGGAPDWVEEHVLDDADFPSQSLVVFGAAGKSKDDVWFAGGRNSHPFFSCPIVIRKALDGYQRVFDGVIGNSMEQPCEDRPGTLRLADFGWLTDLEPAGDRRFLALRNMDHVTEIRVNDDGGYAFASAKISNGPDAETFYSLWVSGEEAWLSGRGLILHGPIARGPFGASTIALTGAPLNRTMYRVRGMGHDNLWAVGAGYAFHKTTP